MAGALPLLAAQHTLPLSPTYAVYRTQKGAPASPHTRMDKYNTCCYIAVTRKCSEFLLPKCFRALWGAGVAVFPRGGLSPLLISNAVG